MLPQVYGKGTLPRSALSLHGGWREYYDVSWDVVYVILPAPQGRSFFLIDGVLALRVVYHGLIFDSLITLVTCCVIPRADCRT